MDGRIPVERSRGHRLLGRLLRPGAWTRLVRAASSRADQEDGSVLLTEKEVQAELLAL